MRLDSCSLLLLPPPCVTFREGIGEFFLVLSEESGAISDFWDSTRLLQVTENNFHLQGSTILLISSSVYHFGCQQFLIILASAQLASRTVIFYSEVLIPCCRCQLLSLWLRPCLASEFLFLPMYLVFALIYQLQIILLFAKCIQYDTDLVYWYAWHQMCLTPVI